MPILCSTLQQMELEVVSNLKMVRCNMNIFLKLNNFKVSIGSKAPPKTIKIRFQIWSFPIPLVVIMRLWDRHMGNVCVSIQRRVAHLHIKFISMLSSSTNSSMISLKYGNMMIVDGNDELQVNFSPILTTPIDLKLDIRS